MKGKSLRFLVTGLAAIAAGVIGALVPATANAVTTTYVAGATGALVSYGPTYCNGAPSRSLTTAEITVRGTPSYAYSSQTVYMIPRIDYSPNGTNWYVHRWGSWQSRALIGDTISHAFNPQTIQVSGPGYYRVLMIFNWYVGNTKVGEVWDLFKDGSDGWGDYWASSGTAVARTASSGSFCAIY